MLNISRPRHFFCLILRLMKECKKLFGKLYSEGLKLLVARIMGLIAFLCTFSSLSFLQRTQTVFFCSFNMTLDASAEPIIRHTRHIRGAQSCCRMEKCHVRCQSINNLYVARRKVSPKKRAASCPLNEILVLPLESIRSENLGPCDIILLMGEPFPHFTYCRVSFYRTFSLYSALSVQLIQASEDSVVNFLTCLWTFKCYCSNHNTSKHLHRFQQ